LASWVSQRRPNLPGPVAPWSHIHAMSKGVREETIARAFLTLGALFPYRRLLTFGTIYVTDDRFTSDIFNGELPGRVLIGQLLRHGQVPLWTPQLCSGIPLTGGVGEPFGLAAFSLLSPAVALDLFLIVLLLVAAHGTYGLARRFGAARPGAVLAGVAFAGSGYIACQLKHLSIVSTVVWLPVGLSLLDRALAPGPAPQIRPESSHEGLVAAPTSARRGLAVAAFGLVFAEQMLSAFPQSAYICALTYGSFVVFRVFTNPPQPGRFRVSLVLLGSLGIVTAIAGAAGAIVLLPLSELGNVSDRSQALGFEWSTVLAYWPPNVMTFLVPYINGDISDNTYVGRSLFWEDYGYVGAATFVIALYGAVREWRRPLVAFSIAMTLVAYLLVLGRATPLFSLVYTVVPGMKLFRFPTRFLIVVELGLAVLAGIGLTRLSAELERRLSTVAPRAPRLIVAALCLGTVLDLSFYQPRQNPMVSADAWLAPPQSVEFIRADNLQLRTFTPGHRELHRRGFVVAHGWANLAPYFALRDLLEPNAGGGFWGIPSADCYAGIAPRWYVDVWGDHNRDGLVLSRLARVNFAGQTLRVRPMLGNVLRTFGVSHLLSAYPVEGADMPLASHEGNAYIYRVDGAARLRFVRAARHVRGDDEAAARLIDITFDPDREILLHDAPTTMGPTVEEVESGDQVVTKASAVITREDSRELAIDAEAPQDGFLLLADTFYPGWIAELDGKPVSIYRANLSVRGIQLPKGRHNIRFVYQAPGFAWGLRITLVAVSILLLWLGAAAYFWFIVSAKGTGSRR
jgi:hypothetical protein